MDSPDQGAQGIPVASTSFEKGILKLSLPDLTVEYIGKLGPGQVIAGNFTQRGMTFPLDLSRQIVEKEKPIRPQEPKNTRSNIEDTEMVLKTATGELYGTLTFPDNQTSVPVALIIAGSGPTDRNGNNPMMTNNSLKMLAGALAKNGIASLRYDKRGIAESTAAVSSEANLRFENYINDAVAWVHFLKEKKLFSSITIIGHSEGSLIGMVAAQDNDVSRFVSIAGAGEPADQTLRKQLKAQPPDVLGQSSQILDSLVAGETVENVPPMLNALFRKSVQPYLISWFKYDPAIEIAKLKKPVLIVQGTTDIQVSQDDAQMLKVADPRAKLVIINGMNHIFKNAEADRAKNIQTYNQPDLPINQELVQAIGSFIKDQ
jgi:hypothetical protein